MIKDLSRPKSLCVTEVQHQPSHQKNAQGANKDELPRCPAASLPITKREYTPQRSLF